MRLGRLWLCFNHAKSLFDGMAERKLRFDIAIAKLRRDQDRLH